MFRVKYRINLIVWIITYWLCMAKKQTQTEFVKRLKVIFGDTLEYSEVLYVNTKTPVTLTCPKHGRFTKTPANLLKGSGCPKCGYERIGEKLRNNTKQFLARAREVHGQKFDYSQTEYVDAITPVTIICPEHGKFKQRPNDHLRTTGCPRCGTQSIGQRLMKPREQFITEATDKHQGKFNYSRVDYRGAHVPVVIGCPTHGWFTQTPSTHLNTLHGCPMCADEASSSTQQADFQVFLSRARERFQDTYNYNQESYRGIAAEMEIVCPVHGRFTQVARDHLKSPTGCPRCSAEGVGAQQTSTTEEFATRASEVHGGRYDYSKATYEGCKQRVCVVCPEHGEFWQTPDGHLQGKGCPRCGVSRISRAEQELYEFIQSSVPHLVVNQQTYIDYGSVRRYLDITVPLLGLAVEYNGLYWHSSARGGSRGTHAFKSHLADYHGYRLIHVFEDDWLYRRRAVEHLLTYALGLLPTIKARKTEVITVSHEEAKKFYTYYHMQGASRAAQQAHYGLTHQGELVAVMSFSQYASGRMKLKGNRWELVRFASKYRVQGGASKLFAKFVRDKTPEQVVSFSWNHLFDGGMYANLGFSLDKTLPPDYSYVDTRRIKRLHKSGFQHSKLRYKFGANYDPNKTEQENCERNHYHRIYDCGKKRWLWTA